MQHYNRQRRNKCQLLILFGFLWSLSQNLLSQTFPNAAQLSTGQGLPGQLDPLWLSSDWFNNPPSSPNGIAFDSCLINNSCAPGAWVDPTTLPPPVNNANWITGNDGPCDQNTGDGYQFFRLPLNLPSSCNGVSILDEGVYHLFLSGYADNSIHDVFINGISQGISGGDFTSAGFLQMDLDGPWLVGENFVDVLIYNIPNGTFNPYGLLLVADSNAGSNSDLDNDGVVDFLDECPCLAGNMSNGCPSGEFQLNICSGESVILAAPAEGTYTWSTGQNSETILVAPLESTLYQLTVTDNEQNSSSYTFEVVVNNTYEVTNSIVLCEGEQIIIDGIPINNSGIYVSQNETILGCDSTVITELSISPASNIDIEFNLCAGDSLFFNDNYYFDSGEFIFFHTGSNGCDSTVTLTIKETPCLECHYFFPNIFTPNDDGLNDVFDINEGGCSKKDYLLNIYDRWGRIVFSADSPEQYWNGVFEGVACPDGTYYYVANYRDQEGVLQRKSGYVQLLD